MEETSLILRIISKYLHAVRDLENVNADDTSLWRAVFHLVKMKLLKCSLANGQKLAELETSCL